MFRFVLAFCVTALPSFAQDMSAADIAALPAALQSRITKATATCAEFESGALTVAADAVTRPDLNRDGTPDWILADSGFACSSALSLFCGTGGCDHTVLVGDTPTQVFAKGIDIFAGEYETAMIAWVHGSLCGGDNTTQCALAMVWQDGVWNSVPTAN